MKKLPSLAVWDTEFLRPLVEHLEKSTESFNVIVTSPERCEQLVLAGMVDVALVSSISVFLHEDDLDVYSAAAISSWKFPYARLACKGKIGDPVSRVEYAAEARNYAVIARIVTNEHYRQMPQFVESQDPRAESDQSGYILTDPGADTPDCGIVFDLGQEWFELTGYPMVWGLFASAKGSLMQRTNAVLKEVATRFKLEKDEGGLEAGDERIEDFYNENIRIGYDDLATASLTELSQYLFYYNIIDQPITVPLIAPEESD